MAVLGEKVIWFCPQQMCPEFWTIFLLYFLIVVWLLALFWPYNRIDTKQIAILIACLALNEYFRHISIPWAITRKKYETFKCCVSTIKCNTFVTHITSTALSNYLARQRRETKGEICSEIYVDLFVEAFENKRCYYALLSFAGCLLQPNVKRLVGFGFQWASWFCHFKYVRFCVLFWAKVKDFYTFPEILHCSDWKLGCLACK